MDCNVFINKTGELDTLISPKGIGNYFMIYKNLSISINGVNVVQINRRKARKLYDLGHEVFLHPCKMALQGFWQQPCEISKNIANDPDFKFDNYVNSYEFYNCNSEMGNYPRFFVAADVLAQVNAGKS